MEIHLGKKIPREVGTVELLQIQVYETLLILAETQDKETDDGQIGFCIS